MILLLAHAFAPPASAQHDDEVNFQKEDVRLEEVGGLSFHTGDLTRQPFLRGSNSTGMEENSSEDSSDEINKYSDNLLMYLFRN